MDLNTSKDDLIREIKELKRKSLIRDNLAARLIDATRESFLREKELHAIMEGSKGVLEAKGFAESARSIFDHCKDLIGATSGYVALFYEQRMG